jgi:tetratricopeptide (TPR) repeat protein
VKSANVMLDPQGEPHLLDFGLALRHEGADRMTLDGSVLGTPAYIAPEVATGRRDLWGPATDQYALGVVLYELLTGGTPFAGPAAVVVSLQQLTDPPPPAGINPAVPRDLEAVCLKCLEKDPAKRYADCQALADDLRRWLDGESPRARPAGMAERVRRWARRHPAVAALSASLVVLLLVVSWQWYEADRARRLAEAAEAEATSSAAAARRSAAAADAVNHFLIVDLINSANPENALGRKITVEEVLVNAAQRLGTKFADQPTVEAAIRQALGNSFYSLGDYAWAEPLLRDALAIHCRVSGERDLETLGSQNDLAVLLYVRNRLAEAEELFTQVLAARTEILGVAHPKTLESMNNLAALRHAQDRWTEARALYDQVLNERRRVLGPGHPDTLIALNNLAELLGSHDPAADAAGMFQECIDGLRKTRGPGHPDTLKAMNNLAGLLLRNNDPGGAESMFREVLAARLKVLGADHADTLQTRNDLAAVLFQRGKLDEAVPMMRAVWEVRDKTLGPTDRRTLQSANNLGYMLLVQAESLASRDKVDDAAAALRSAEEACAKLPPNHWLHIDIAGVRGGILLARKQFADAEPLVVSAFEKLNAAAAPAARKQAARERVIRLYEATGRKDRAAELRAPPR